MGQVVTAVPLAHGQAEGARMGAPAVSVGLRALRRPTPIAKGTRWVFLTFADRRLERTLRRIRREARAMGCFDAIHALDERDLSPAFRARFADKLRPEVRGFGYWVWKPEILLRQLERMEEGEELLYTDAGCRLNPEGRVRLEDWERL